MGPGGVAASIDVEMLRPFKYWVVVYKLTIYLCLTSRMFIELIKLFASGAYF